MFTYLRHGSCKNELGIGPKQIEQLQNTASSSAAPTQLRAMAAEIVRRSLKATNFTFLKTLTASQTRIFSNLATSAQPESSDDPSSSSFTFYGGDPNSATTNDNIIIKGPKNTSPLSSQDSASVSMPMSFMTGSIVGKRFYKKVTTREADDGIGWSVMLDYRTLKTPSKRPLKCPTLALAKAIAAEWEHQVLILVH